MRTTQTKRILFKVAGFPMLSETFVIRQITMALKQGFDARILSKVVYGPEHTSLPTLIDHYDLIARSDVQSRPIPRKGIYRIGQIFRLIRSSRNWSWLKTLNPFIYGMYGLKGLLIVDLYSVRYYLNYDLVHAQFGPNAYPFDLLKDKGLFKGGLITTFHGYDTHLDGMPKALIEQKYKVMFSIADLITVNTPYLAGLLEQLNCPQEKLEVIHMPVDTDFFSPKSVERDKTGFRLISVGRLIELKGHIFGIRAVKVLREQGFEVAYTIVGDGPLKRELEVAIEDLDMIDCVKLYGAAQQHEIRDLLRQSDVFLMTSVTDTYGRREAQGLVCGEAQSCQVPVVAFDSGGVPYTMRHGETGYLVPEADFKAMAAKLQVLLKNDELKTKMGKAGRQFIVDNFSLKSIEKRWESIYKSILGDG